MKATLAYAFAAIEKEEAAIAGLVKEERKLRTFSRIEEGRRILPQKEYERFQQIGFEITRRERTIKKIMEPQMPQFRRLRKLEREWLRLQGKEKVYSIDVELDDIMTFYRVSLVNMYSYLSYELFGKKAISMSRLVQSILQLPALVEETLVTKSIMLEYNEKDPEAMASLQTAIAKINGLRPKTLNGKTIDFKVGNIDYHLNSIK